MACYCYSVTCASSRDGRRYATATAAGATASAYATRAARRPATADDITAQRRPVVLEAWLTHYCRILPASGTVAVAVASTIVAVAVASAVVRAPRAGRFAAAQHGHVVVNMHGPSCVSSP